MTTRRHRRRRPVRFDGHGDVTIAGDESGDPDGPPVVFLHGWGQTRHAWGATIEALGRRGWRAITLDLRGHGESDWPSGADYEPESFSRDVAAVVEGIGRPTALVGASLGGISSLLATTLLSAQQVTCLVLVDVTPQVRTEGAWRILEFMTAGAEGFDTLEEVAAAVADYLPHRERPPDLTGLRKNLRVGDDGRYHWHWDPRFLEIERFAPPTREVLEHYIHDNRRRTLEAARRLQVPVLLIRGRLSDIVSDEAAAELLDAAAFASYVDVTDAGHMVAGDSNDRFTEAVASFLDEHASPSGRADDAATRS